MNNATRQYEYYEPPTPPRKHPIPEGFDLFNATWAQLEAIMFDRPFPQ